MCVCVCRSFAQCKYSFICINTIYYPLFFKSLPHFFLHCVYTYISKKYAKVYFIASIIEEHFFPINYENHAQGIHIWYMYICVSYVLFFQFKYITYAHSLYVCIVEWYTRAVAVGGGSNMCAVRATSNQNCRTLCCVRVAAKWICVVVVVFYMHMYVYVYINTNVLSACFKVCCVCCVYNAHRISTINFRCAPWFAAVYV